MHRNAHAVPAIRVFAVAYSDSDWIVARRSEVLRISRRDQSDELRVRQAIT